MNLTVAVYGLSFLIGFLFMRVMWAVAYARGERLGYARGRRTAETVARAFVGGSDARTAYPVDQHPSLPSLEHYADDLCRFINEERWREATWLLIAKVDSLYRTPTVAPPYVTGGDQAWQEATAHLAAYTEARRKDLEDPPPAGWARETATRMSTRCAYQSDPEDPQTRCILVAAHVSWPESQEHSCPDWPGRTEGVR